MDVLYSEEAPCILVVDDTPENLRLLHELLKRDYRVKLASSGRKAIEIARTAPQPDLILLDIMMPEMDGYATCAQLKAQPETRETPIIFLTALTSPEDEELGITLGAVDYISKPFSPSVVLARIRNHLNQKAMADFLRSKHDYLERIIAERTRQIQAVQDATILAMASLAEARDYETGNHIRRTQHYVRVLAEQLAPHPRFAAFLSRADIEILFKSAPLHDIGKVGIPDHILLKPGRLNVEEFEIMKRHAVIGRDAIEQAEKELGAPLDFLAVAKQIAFSHHEKWDGSGYPQGLQGEDIPVAARLMALADVFDALISPRSYKPPMPYPQARAVIVEGRATHFDPDVVDAFLAQQQGFLGIARRYGYPEAGFGEPATAAAGQAQP